MPDLGCIFSGKEKEVSLLEDMDAGGFERELLHLLVDICQLIRYIDHNRQKADRDLFYETGKGAP